MKAYTALGINITALCYNASYWQRPYEFLPDRFDPQHELSKTPSGEKRPPMCFVPFNGGKRVCFGKTFAELTLRTVVAMLTQQFDFELVREEESCGVATRPHSIQIAQSHYPPIYMKLTRANRP